MTGERRRSRTSETDFLDTPMYRLVDRHRAILEKIRTREHAKYWGHMLIGEYYPDIPNSRSASGKLAALVGLTDYMDFFCAGDYYDLLKEGKTLEEARRILAKRWDRAFKRLDPPPWLQEGRKARDPVTGGRQGAGGVKVPLNLGADRGHPKFLSRSQGALPLRRASLYQYAMHTMLA